VLFNSHEFLFIFLPLSLALNWALRHTPTAQQVALVAASAVFYAAWSPYFLLLLWGSIVTNYVAGFAIERALWRQRKSFARGLLAAAITADLGMIGVFKYAGFFATNINLLFGSQMDFGKIVLPLGISFFTFEQISYLVDVHRGQSRSGSFLDYAFFVSFFPRLVAGPILRFREIAPQLRSGDHVALGSNLAIGLTIFFIGLAKKSILADGIAVYSAPGFVASAAGTQLDFFTAWSSALAYSLQLYFDFSGYSDMAIGIARCFGIRFPMNFFSPYKSSSIKEFWTRWHMTLSRFLRDYLYVALGGNRRGPVRRYWNLMVTMLLGGLWHGASWTFVLWGGLHGLYLVINHAWLAIAAQSTELSAFRISKVGRGLGVLVTFLAVVFAWVFFRSPNFATALKMIEAMLGAKGAALPTGLAFALQPIEPVLAALGIGFVEESGAEFLKAYLWIAVLLVIVLAAPSTQEIMSKAQPVLESSAMQVVVSRAQFAWTPSRTWAVVTGGIAFLAVISITRVSEFLYWQF
jgi:D-alanyl-lipoteichoic acid acyltransferase DltB (MBOAT superfamily)